MRKIIIQDFIDRNKTLSITTIDGRQYIASSENIEAEEEYLYFEKYEAITLIPYRGITAIKFFDKEENEISEDMI